MSFKNLFPYLSLSFYLSLSSSFVYSMELEVKTESANTTSPTSALQIRSQPQMRLASEALDEPEKPHKRVKQEPAWPVSADNISSYWDPIDLTMEENITHNIKQVPGWHDKHLSVNNPSNNSRELPAPRGRSGLTNFLFSEEKNITSHEAEEFLKIVPVDNFSLLRYRELFVLVKMSAIYPELLSEKTKTELFNYFIKQDRDKSERIYEALYRIYGNGIGVEKNPEEGFNYCKLAADQGSVTAQFNLGLCYSMGEGVARDFSKAIEYWELSTKQGYAPAQVFLARCYAEGKGVAQDFSKAIEYYQLSANQGNKVAQLNLGFCYATGKDVIQDFKKAVEYYQLAANQGYAAAQFSLGNCYFEGKGIEKNLENAFKYYELAADQGHREAQDALGNCYYNGKGVEKNLENAFKYYQLAANQGHGEAKQKFRLKSLLLNPFNNATQDSQEADNDDEDIDDEEYNENEDDDQTGQPVTPPEILPQTFSPSSEVLSLRSTVPPHVSLNTSLPPSTAATISAYPPQQMPPPLVSPSSRQHPHHSTQSILKVCQEQARKITDLEGRIAELEAQNKVYNLKIARFERYMHEMRERYQ